jgi:hypothetical protein
MNQQMNQQVKEKWLSALRSGAYAQGEHYLRRGDGSFCCLGVLCDLYAKEHPVGWRINDDPNDKSSYIFGDDSTVFLPLEVVQWAELTAHDPIVYVNGGERRLSLLNDIGNTFNDIADLIEENL